MSETLVVFDLDGTLTRRDTYTAYLLAFLRRRPLRLGRTWRLPFDTLHFFAGAADNAWLKQRYLRAVLGDVPRGIIETHTRDFNARLLARGLRQQALERLAAHRERGDRVILATASLDLYVEDLAARLGIAETVCTCVAWSADDRLTGSLAGANCRGAEKLARVRALSGVERHAHRVVYTDHHSDAPLLEWAHERVAVAPSRALAARAADLGLKVVHWR